jgi:hypothetical protein
LCINFDGLIKKGEKTFCKLNSTGGIHLEKLISNAIDLVCSRALPEGGFSVKGDGIFRPDATAWAILALKSGSCCDEYISRAHRHLAQSQLPDGRVPLITAIPAAYWPTALAVLAWQKSVGYGDSVQKAVTFLINNIGLHFTKTKDSVTAHDSEIKGWPWVENTHSWVEPTSMAVLALRSSGHGEHARVLEAVRMLLDRQLPSGGWNMGNTLVFGKELLPFPESTGHALTALNGFTNTEVVQKSLDYLNKIIQGLRTPLALAWGLFGLTSWNCRPENYRRLILETLERQEKYGPYDTDLLSQLIVAYYTEADLIRFVSWDCLS